MLDYRNILRVSSDPDKSIRTMELELRSSHHTIRTYLHFTVLLNGYGDDPQLARSKGAQSGTEYSMSVGLFFLMIIRLAVMAAFPPAALILIFYAYSRKNTR